MEVIILVGLILAIYYIEVSILPNNKRIKEIQKELDKLDNKE